MKIIANCASYNDYKDVLFMMDSDDYRLSDPDYGYTKISDGEYHKNLRKFITSDGVIYTVFMDWSVKKDQDRN
jgi:hypothetical protein